MPLSDQPFNQRRDLRTCFGCAAFSYDLRPPARINKELRHEIIGFYRRTDAQRRRRRPDDTARTAYAASNACAGNAADRGNACSSVSTRRNHAFADTSRTGSAASGARTNDGTDGGRASAASTSRVSALFKNSD